MTIYITGDIHSNVYERFSFRNHPELRNLTENDVMIILGDFGVIWDKELTPPEENKLDWLAEKPWTTIAITGNHENYDRILALPIVEKFGGQVRDLGYDNIFLVPDITVFDIEDNHILCLPRADSHDIYKVSPGGDLFQLGTGYSNLIDPALDSNKKKRKAMRKAGLWYRVIGESWWPQEKIPIEEYMDFMEQHEDEYFDMILSHDAPGQINNWYGGGAERPNEGQRYFDILADTLNFRYWLHGHFHFDKP